MTTTTELLNNFALFLTCTTRRSLLETLCHQRWVNHLLMPRRVYLVDLIQKPVIVTDYFANLRQGYSQISDQLLKKSPKLATITTFPVYYSLRQNPPRLSSTDTHINITQRLTKQHLNELEALLVPKPDIIMCDFDDDDSSSSQSSTFEEQPQANMSFLDIGYLYCCILPHLYWIYRLSLTNNTSGVTPLVYNAMMQQFWHIWDSVFNDSMTPSLHATLPDVAQMFHTAKTEYAEVCKIML
jgi:hypothetical protein